MSIAVGVPEAIGAFENSLLKDFAARITEWSRCRQSLTEWEDEHLAAENPPPEKLAQHKKMLESLIFFGQLFSFATSDPDFPDPELSEMVHSNQFILREKFRMFHNPMSRLEADSLLREVFPES